MKQGLISELRIPPGGESIQTVLRNYLWQFFASLIQRLSMVIDSQNAQSARIVTMGMIMTMIVNMNANMNVNSITTLMFIITITIIMQ